MPEMVAPRALVFRPLVKGNEALGTRLHSVSIWSIWAFCLRMREMNGMFERVRAASPLRRVTLRERSCQERWKIIYIKFTHISNTVDMHFVCRDFG